MENGPNIVEKGRKMVTFSGCLLFLMLAVLLLGFFAPRGGHGVNGIKIGTRSTEHQIVAAINSYKTEYRNFPGSRVDGSYEDPASQAQLFGVLRALETQQNFRGIVYFEARNARLKKSKPWGRAMLRDGFDQATGTLYDPYGQPYRIRIQTKADKPVVSPYQDAPAEGERVIVWSLGEDGRQGSDANPQKFEGSDDVVSWK